MSGQIRLTYFQPDCISMRSFFYLVLEISMSIMINLPFSARGPFRITGAWCLKYNRHIYKFSIGAPFRFWIAPYNYTIGDVTRHVCRVCWYRKPSLNDCGPFRFYGRAYNPSQFGHPRVFIYAFFWKWNWANGKYYRGLAKLTPWIYYSRNISTEVTCH